MSFMMTIARLIRLCTCFGNERRRQILDFCNAAQRQINNIWNQTSKTRCICWCIYHIILIALGVFLAPYVLGSDSDSKTNPVMPNIGDAVHANTEKTGTATSGSRFKMTNRITYSGGRMVDAPTSWEFKNDKHCASMSKFIVFSTINPSNDPNWPAVVDFNAIPNWCTVVVGDKKSKNASEYMEGLDSTKVVYLDEPMQRQMFKDSPIFEHTPWGHFGRKNLGFIYAVKKGAEVIYDTDDDNVLISRYKKWIPVWTQSGKLWDKNITVKKLVIPPNAASTTTTFNIFSLYTHKASAEYSSRVWPRGYDLSVLAESLRTHSTFDLVDADNGIGGNSVRYPIQQWLANVEPDLDAIGRLIGNNNPEKEDKYQFDPRRRFALSIPNDLMVPFNAQMTVWQSPSFLLLYLPTTVHGRVSDIWRSYFAQTVFKVMADCGVQQQLLYCPVLVDQLRNSHDNLADFNSELPLYEQTPALLQHLVEFTERYQEKEGCDGRRESESESRFMARVLLELYIEMYEYNIIELRDVQGVKAWISIIIGAVE